MRPPDGFQKSMMKSHTGEPHLYAGTGGGVCQSGEEFHGGHEAGEDMKEEQFMIDHTAEGMNGRDEGLVKSTGQLGTALYVFYKKVEMQTWLWYTLFVGKIIASCVNAQ